MRGIFLVPNGCVQLTSPTLVELNRIAAQGLEHGIYECRKGIREIPHLVNRCKLFSLGAIWAMDIFISYATADKATAEAACAALEAKGIRCWIAPRDVVPGWITLRRSYKRSKSLAGCS